MNIFEETFEAVSNQVLNVFARPTVFDDIKDFLAKAERELTNFEKTGSFNIGECAPNIKRERITNVASTNENTKENVDSTRNKPQPVRRTTRTTALQGGLNNLNVAKTLSVKLERISEVNPCSDITEMPPPQEPVRKGRQKKDVTVVIEKELSLSSNSERDSDVIFQPAHVSVISLTDTEEEIKRRPTRSTRTKTRTMTKKDETIPAIPAENFEKLEKVTDSGEPPTVTNSVNSKDTGDDVNEKPTRSTRTKTRAIAQKQNKEDEKDLTEKDGVSQSNVKISQIENIVQKIVTEEFENRVNKQTTASVSSEEGEAPKLKKKDKKTVKRLHSLSPLRNEGKRQKSSELNKHVNISNETFIKSPYKDGKETDAINQTVIISKPADATVILDKPTVVNETVIVPKDKRMVVTTPLNKQVNLSDLITDDEDDRIYSKTTNKKPGKPIFGFENSPVKKRVEAFEKLGVQQVAKDSSKLTKKTKPKPSRNEEDQNRKDISLKPAIKDKVKMFTATPLKNLSKVPIASKSALKTMKPSFKEAMLPLKSASALKAYQQDFIERELRRQEKELEASRKREALLQAKKNENKRKREEKQQKAQQMIEALEKTKKQQMKSTKITEQKCAVVEQKFQMEKEVSVFKTPIKQTKSTSVKKVTQKPIYLEMSPPLLPVDDCYDSDDERNVGKATRPDWTKRHKMYCVLYNISFSPDDVTNTFYMRKAATPDLQLLFGRINPNKLKRTSSAIWNKPPRFTIMPIPNEEDEDDLS